ncbi:MAG TPA: ABC transporter permease [Planctomycetota bacterium]|nr:ABC transporter permease [Planctomycetota bacterium]
MADRDTSTRTRALRFALWSVVFAAGELLWLARVLSPDLRSATIYALILSSNLFYLYNLIYHISLRPRWVQAAYVGWYVALFALFVAVAPSDRWVFGGTHRLLLFGLFLLLTSSLFHMPTAFGFMVVLLVAYLVFPFFAEATLVLLTIFYLIVLAEVRAARETRSYLVLTCFVLGFVLLLAVLFPLVNLGASRSPQDLRTALLGSDAAAEGTRAAMWMSIQTATVTTLVVLALGVPMAYFLVRSDFPGRRVLDALVDLPIILPPPVVGIAIAQLVGKEQPLGAWLNGNFGIVLDNDWKGIVLAQTFISCPFLIRSAMAAFQAVDPRLENVSRTLGAGPLGTFFRVTLPLAWRGIFMGCILTWGRAISDFSAVTVVAQHPETMPVRIYKQFIEAGEKGQHTTLAILMILLCVVVFAVLHLVASRTVWRNVRTIWSRAGDSSRRPE